MDKLFDDMSRDEQVAAIRELMGAGNSYRVTGDILGTTKGTVAGICRDYHIPSKNKPGFGDVPKGPSGYVLRIAESEATRCKAKVENYQCRYEREPGSDYCARPVHQTLEKRRG